MRSRRSGSELHVRTEIVAACFTRFAAPAGEAGLDGYAVADFEGGDCATDLVDGAGCFVAHDEGAGRVDFVGHAAVVPEVHLEVR